MTKCNPGKSKFTVMIDEDLAPRLSKPFHHGEKAHFFRALLETLAEGFESGLYEDCMQWLHFEKPLVIPAIPKRKEFT